MAILNNDKIFTTFAFSKYFIENKKSVSDICKFSISDDGIDYTASPNSIKTMMVESPITNDNLGNMLFLDNSNIFDMVYEIRSDGLIVIDDTFIKVTNGLYVEFEFYGDRGYFVEILNKNFVKSFKIDDIDVYNYEKSYIYIKNKIRIYFDNIVINSNINFYSEKRNLTKSFSIVREFGNIGIEQ